MKILVGTRVQMDGAAKRTVLRLFTYGLFVLTVSDGDGSGIVDFFLRNGKVRFQVNSAKAQVAGLSLSNEIMALARNKA